MKHFILIIITVSLSLAGCRQGDSSDPLSLFGGESAIAHQTVQIDHHKLYQRGEMILFPQHEKIVLQSIGSPSHLLTEISLDDLIANERLRKGNGPNEFRFIRLTPTSFRFDVPDQRERQRLAIQPEYNRYQCGTLEAKIDSAMFDGILRTKFNQYIGDGIFNGGRYKIYDAPTSK